MPDSLAAKWRAKYPGAYDDLSDADLEAKVLAKYPAYKDLATPPFDLSLAHARQMSGTMTEGPDPPPPTGLLADTNRALMGAAYPQSAGDFAQLLIPAGVSTAINAGKAYLSAGAEAFAANPKLRSLPGGMLRVLAKRASAPPPRVEGLERFGGTSSGYVAGEAANTTSEAIPGLSMPQGTYVKLPDGSYGIRGRAMTPGGTVNVMPRSGNASVKTVGSILDDTGGVQSATLRDTTAARPRISAVDYQRIEALKAQGVPETEAVAKILEMPYAPAVSVRPAAPVVAPAVPSVRATVATPAPSASVITPPAASAPVAAPRPPAPSAAVAPSSPNPVPASETPYERFVRVANDAITEAPRGWTAETYGNVSRASLEEFAQTGTATIKDAARYELRRRAAIAGGGTAGAALVPPSEDASERFVPPEITVLAPQDEAQFQAWVQAHQDAPGVTHYERAPYDLRGFWADKEARAQWHPGDHFPDTYKQHGHPTFSQESKYSTGTRDGGRWDGETFIPPTDADPKRTDIGFLGVGPSSPHDADHPAALNALIEAIRRRLRGE